MSATLRRDVLSTSTKSLPPSFGLEDERFHRRDLEMRCLILRSYVESMTQSGSWKLAAPLRSLRNVLKPRGCARENLIAWHDLSECEDGVCRSTGNDPQFIVPCFLPAGWVRIKLGISGPARGRTELFIDT